MKQIFPDFISIPRVMKSACVNFSLMGPVLFENKTKQAIVLHPDGNWQWYHSVALYHTIVNLLQNTP